MQCALKHTDKLTSPKQKLLAFDTAHDLDLLGSRLHNFRNLQHSCSSHAAALLACLEDIAQNHPFYCSSYIPEICAIVHFYRSKSYAP